MGEVSMSLRERLRLAVLETEARAGRGGVSAKLAVEVASLSLCRTMRAARRSLVETRARFALSEVAVPTGVPVPVNTEAALTDLFGAEAAAEALRVNPLPLRPPGVEDEAVPGRPDGSRCLPSEAVPLPLSEAAWHREHERQEREGFQPRACTALRWKEDPPQARPGHVLTWGQHARVEDSPLFCSLLGKEVRQGCVEVVGLDQVDVVTRSCTRSP
jgi:hypothetical protein